VCVFPPALGHLRIVYVIPVPPPFFSFGCEQQCPSRSRFPEVSKPPIKSQSLPSDLFLSAPCLPFRRGLSQRFAASPPKVPHKLSPSHWRPPLPLLFSRVSCCPRSYYRTPSSRITPPDFCTLCYDREFDVFEFFLTGPLRCRLLILPIPFSSSTFTDARPDRGRKNLFSPFSFRMKEATTAMSDSVPLF